VTEPSTIPELVAAAANRFGNLTAIVDGDTNLTYADLRARARTFAGALMQSGIGPGDRVAIWLFNSVEWVIAALGIWEAGAVLVPVNTRFKAREAADILGRSRARLLVTTTDFLGTDYVAMLESAGIDLPDLHTIVAVRTSAWDEFLQPTAEAAGQAAVGPDDLSDILFTSGTTGAPKGVVQTHGRTLRVATDWVAMTGLSAGDRYLMVNPYFHMFGLKAGILACMVAGATMLPERVFDPDQVLARVADERVTVLPGAPTLYQALLDHPERDRYDITSLRVAVTGAADIPVELIRRVGAELPFETIITGYGLTEAGTATATSPTDDAETIATTVGRPRPGFELRIDAQPGEAGEILLKGGSVMSHYLDDPDATAQAMTDGWLRTGDLGVLDDRGCLRIVGRAKDMFIVGGFNAYPAEIENALLRHPDIVQAAVIGIPDERLGEVGLAFVVAKPGVTPVEIIGWARGEMANYKVPRRVEIIDALPLNATGKVMKDVLRQRAGGT
jgi:acyl-CoA synthetase (AMP-forming)/AMP-acid ligase II